MLTPEHPMEVTVMGLVEQATQAVLRSSSMSGGEVGGGSKGLPRT